MKEVPRGLVTLVVAMRTVTAPQDNPLLFYFRVSEEAEHEIWRLFKVIDAREMTPNWRAVKEPDHTRHFPGRDEPWHASRVSPYWLFSHQMLSILMPPCLIR